MAENITIRKLQNRAGRFLRCGSLEELARLLITPALQLLSLAEAPDYDEFTTPKKNGSRRLIEDPVPPLKKVQRKLNDYLQAVYYFHRTDAAYGFLVNPVGDPAPRHILSNAQRHQGCQWLLNLDMEDFFHLISEERVKNIFQSTPFDFKEPISALLAALCCHKERLPMGAPTSPVLSNLAGIPLDRELQTYADERRWTYTRYADDMSFSSQVEITPAHITELRNRIEAHGFRLNPEKVQLYEVDREDKEVTGLIVRNDRIDLPDDYLEQLTRAIDHLDQIVNAKYTVPSGRREATAWLDELEAQIRGKLEFARQILGEDDLLYQDLALQLEEAILPPEQYGPMNWLDFGYTLFK